MNTIRQLREWYKLPKSERIRLRIVALRWEVLFDLRKHDRLIKRINRLLRKLEHMGIQDPGL